MHTHKLENQAIEIVAQAMETDEPSTFDTASAMELVAHGMSKRCADKVFAQAGFAPGEGREDVGVIELHDCFAPTEVGVMICRHNLAMTWIASNSSSYTLPWVFVNQKRLTRLWRMATTP